MIFKYGFEHFCFSLLIKKCVAVVGQAPKDYDILAIPLTSAALRMLTTRKGTPEEWRQYLSRSSSDL